MDIEKILEEVRNALFHLEPAGGVSGLHFFTARNEHFSAELHIRGGKLACLRIISDEEQRIRDDAQNLI
jgi:hypothetical protein